MVVIVVESVPGCDSWRTILVCVFVFLCLWRLVASWLGGGFDVDVGRRQTDASMQKSHF